MPIARSLLTLLPSIPITDSSKQILQTALGVCIELMYDDLCWSVNTGVSMCRSA